jgi:hypothetical protein
MSARAGIRAVGLVMLAALVGVLLVGRLSGVDASAAQQAKDFTVTAQPVSVSVQRGQTATFQVTVTPVAGFTGKVTLTASGLATGMAATFVPSTLTIDPTALTSTVTVTTSSTTSTGSTSFTVTGTSGSTKRTLALTVVVSAPAPPGLSLAVTPAIVTVAPGSSASYNVAISRVNGYAGPVNLSASSTLPTGVSISLSPSTIPAGTTSPVAVTLTATTSAGSPSSTTSLIVTGQSTGVTPTITSSVSASLVVDTNQSAKPFSIAGNVAGALGPGIPASRIDLVVTNPNNQPLRVTNLGVTVSGTSRAGCSAVDFTVQQYAGSYPLTIPARASAVSLTSLGVPVSALPAVAMLSRTGNQDACKGVTVQLAYTGSATNQ